MKCRDAEDTKADEGEVNADVEPISDREIASADKDRVLLEGKVRLLLEVLPVRGGLSLVCVRSRRDDDE